MKTFLLAASIVLIVAINCSLADKQSAFQLMTLHASCRDKTSKPDDVEEWKLDDKAAVNCYLKCMMSSPLTKMIVNEQFDNTAYINFFNTEDLKTKARTCVADHPVKDDDLCATTYDVFFCVFKNNQAEVKNAYFTFFNTTEVEQSEARPEFVAMMTKLMSNQ